MCEKESVGREYRSRDLVRTHCPRTHQTTSNLQKYPKGAVRTGGYPGTRTVSGAGYKGINCNTQVPRYPGTRTRGIVTQITSVPGYCGKLH
eukprot:2737528-Rhodomonas_salina.1